MLLRTLRALAHTAAGIWLGGMVMLAIVAPTTFGVMRTTGVDNRDAIAGQVMARNFVRFDKVQMSCAAVLLVWTSTTILRKPSTRDWVRAALIAAAAGLMLYSAWTLTPRILDLQPILAGPDPDSAMRAAFDQFHATSVRIAQALLLLLVIVNLELALPIEPAPLNPLPGEK